MPNMLHTAADAVLKRVKRSPLYFGHYNNTLPFSVNRTYDRYANECQRQYEAVHGKVTLPPSPLMHTAATLLQGVFPAEKATAYSEKITAMMKSNHPAVQRPPKEEHLVARITEPLKNLDTGLLDALRSPAVHECLLQFFRSHYRIRTMTCYRSFPTTNVTSSWLWHSDSFPPHTCKLFLHLTPATADRGAMEMMDRADTMAYRRAGYFGQFKEERSADLQKFAQVHGLPYRPFHFEAAPGDVTVFDMNYFHRAVPPRHDFRDVVQFYLLPNPVSWEEQLQRDGIESVSMKENVFPKDPHPDAVAASAPAGAGDMM